MTPCYRSISRYKRVIISLVLSSNRLVSALKIPADNVFICISLHATTQRYTPDEQVGLLVQDTLAKGSLSFFFFFLSKRKKLLEE